jgi:hypothetical protein
MKAKPALGLSNTSNAEVLVLTGHISTNMTANPLFAAADITAQLAVTNTAATALRNAMNATTSDTRTDNIRVARDVLDRNLMILAAKVEAVANNPTLPDDQRDGIIHSAGMPVKGKANPQKRVLAAVPGDTSGTVLLTAPSGGVAHEWAYTTDVVNYTNRITLPATSTASTTVSGLKPLTQYAFFHRAVLRKGSSEWEGPITCMVL